MPCQPALPSTAQTALGTGSRWTSGQNTAGRRHALHLVTPGYRRVVQEPQDPRLPPPVSSPVMPPPALPPAGWYPNADHGYDRWWDGQAWTQHVQHRLE